MTERGGFEALDPCVHCGFCLQACPTFLATGDEADSPRGRIDLMRALEAGELAPDDPALRLHLDRCLGCRGCEPVCPSGVGFGRGMEAARALLATRRRPSALARAALWALTSPGTSRTVYALARMLRATGIPRRLAGWGRLRFAMGMLAATKPTRNAKRGTRNRRAGPSSAFRVPTSALLFRGCVMDGLFAHVHDATIRTLQVNGYSLREVPEQVCCGALHAHAGLRAEARLLARANVAAFGEGDEPIVVNSAGCGAMLKEYGHLVDAAGFRARVRDVTDWLSAGAGARPRRRAAFRRCMSPGGVARRIVPGRWLLCWKQHDRRLAVRLQWRDRGRRRAAPSRAARRARRGGPVAHSPAVLLRLSRLRRPPLPARGLPSRRQAAPRDAARGAARPEVSGVPGADRPIAGTRARSGRLRAPRGGALPPRPRVGGVAAGS